MKRGSTGFLLRVATGTLLTVTGLVATGGPAGAAGRTIAASPNPGTSGRPVSVSGSNWTGYDSVNVFLVIGTTQNFMCTVRADSAGTIAPQSCTVPTNLVHGTYHLSASDATNTVTIPYAFNPGVVVIGVNGQPALRAAAGQTVGLSGSGFDPNSAMKAKFNGANVALVPAATSNASGQVSGTGFVVPATTAAGQYPVTLTDAGGHTATAQLTVFKATLSESPSPAISGHQMSLSGSGWPSNDALVAYLVVGTAFNFVCSVSADSTGALAQSCLVPGNLPHASYQLRVQDASLAVSVPLILNPGVVVIGVNGQPAVWAASGQTVGLSGGGFDPNSAMKAKFNGVKATLVPAATSNAAGQVFGTGFVVPATTAAGQYPVTLTDAAGHTATAQLTVFKATLSATPSPGISGQPISISGTGWPSNDGLQAYLVAGTSFNFVCSVSADSTGAVAQSCPVPANVPHASYQLTLQDASLAKATPLTVNAGIVTTATNGQPLAQAAAGTSMLLNGGGFAANSTISKLTLGTHTVVLSPAIVTNSVGGFGAAPWTVPSIPPGTYVLTAKDAAGNSATSTFIVT